MKIPNIHKLSKASQISLLAVVILLGAVFVTVTSALQTQNSSSHASGTIVYQSGNYYCYYVGLTITCSTPTPTPLNQTPTPTPKGTVCEVIGGIVKCFSPSPTAGPVPTKAPIVPTATKAPVPTAIPTVKPTTAPTQKPIPTNTPVPGDTTINLTLGLQGVGTSGDSANPHSGGNTNPLHQQRNITVSIFDTHNQQVTTQHGTVSYNDATGKFTGNVDLGSQFITGVYTVKVQSPQYLRALVPGIPTITAGRTNVLPATTLVVGDINEDNQINILDYNTLMGCYSDLLPATSCTSANNTLSDLNDDGAINQFDYNLFLRELSNVSGN